jgi:hypothetical protein
MQYPSAVMTLSLVLFADHIVIFIDRDELLLFFSLNKNDLPIDLEFYLKRTRISPPSAS